MKIKDICEAERPRERLLSFGPATLSTGELLSILIRTGTAQYNAIDIARGILSECDGSLSRLSGMDIHQLRSIKGIGREKACTLAACFELARRFLSESVGERTTIRDAAAVAGMMVPRMKGLRHEECHIVLLDSSNRVMGTRKISKGGVHSTDLTPGEVMQICLNFKARSFIIVHNHPGGDPHPSKADISATKDVMQAALSCGLTLLDHVIVCDDCYYSFADEKVARV